MKMKLLMPSLQYAALLTTWNQMMMFLVAQDLTPPQSYVRSISKIGTNNKIFNIDEGHRTLGRGIQKRKYQN